MSGNIAVRCNGPERHINRIDLERLLQTTFVSKSFNMDDRFPNLDDVEFPLYDDCRYCAGRIIITREIAEKSR